MLHFSGQPGSAIEIFVLAIFLFSFLGSIGSQQVPATNNQQAAPAINQQPPVQQQQFQQPPVVQQQQQQPPVVQQQQQQQQPGQFQQQAVPQEQQQFQQPVVPQQQQFQQPVVPQQQQFQQPVVPQQQFQPPVQQHQFQQQPPAVPQQQFQQPVVPQQQQQPPMQQQFQQAPSVAQQQQWQQPPVQQHQFQQPPQAVPQHQPVEQKKVEQRQPKPTVKKPPPIRKVAPPPPPPNANIESIRRPSEVRFKPDMDPSRSYTYMTVEVPPGSRDCYFYNPLINFSVFYQAIKGGDMDVMLAIIDPNSQVVLVKEPAKEGEVKVPVPIELRDQPYAICLDNRKTSYSAKLVYLSIDLDIDYENSSQEELDIIAGMREYFNQQNSGLADNWEEHVANMDSITASIDNIGARFRKIGLQHAKTRNMAFIDGVLMKQNNDKVQNWSLFQVALMITVAVMQTVIIRSLFDGGHISFKGLFTNSTVDSRPSHSAASSHSYSSSFSGKGLQARA